jgi:hypothetical protein
MNNSTHPNWQHYQHDVNNELRTFYKTNTTRITSRHIRTRSKYSTRPNWQSYKKTHRLKQMKDGNQKPGNMEAIINHNC